MGGLLSSTATTARDLSVGEALEEARALLESPTVGPSLLGTLRHYSQDDHRDLLVDESDMRRLRDIVAEERPEQSYGNWWRVAWALVPLIYGKRQEENLGSYPAGFQMSDEQPKRLLSILRGLNMTYIRFLCESFRNSNAVLKRMKLTSCGGLDEEGAASLGSFVGANSTIEELSLQILKPQSGRTLESFFETMQDNRSLRSLTVMEFYVEDPDLARRRKVFEILGDMLQHNSVLATLRINCGKHHSFEQGSIKALADGLLNNTSLEVLHVGPGEQWSAFDIPFICPIILSEADAASLGDMLAANAALQDLQIDAPITCNLQLVAGLSRNSTLNRLWVGLDKVGAEAALDLLTRGGAPNLKSLTLCNCDADVKVLTAMITSNRTLLGLGLPQAAYSKQEWAKAIVPAFGNNTVIRELNLQGCSGVDSSRVYNAMLDLLNSNTTLQTIDLYGTPLQKAGKAESVQEELRINKAYGAALTVVPMPQAFGGSYANTSVESGGRRGVAVILSIEKGRPGGQVDRGRLEVIAKQMAFEPVYFVDPDCADTLRNQFREIAQDSCLLMDDGFLCCINVDGGITRDGNHYVQLGGDRKEKFFVLKDILEPFTRSRYLANKPKVFLINACRGTGTRTPGIEEEEEGEEGRFYVTQQGDRVPDFLHAVSDCMVVFSTSHGDRSIRHPVRGSFFVEALADAFTEAPSTADVQSIMTRVIGMVTEMEGRQHGESGTLVRQCPVMQQTFRKSLYWHRPDM